MAIILDCTLRDGGYLNDWEFGIDTIRYVVQRHIMAGTELIEVGFLDDRRPFDINRTIQPDTSCYERQLAGIDKKDTKLFAMIDYGTCSIDHVLPRTADSMLDGIRIIFKEPKKELAVEFARQVQEKGYMVSLQMVSITAYKDRDILDFCERVNEVKPYAVSIVDTYGLMHQEQVMHYFELLNHNLDKEICLGYHAHNNFQLAYSNSLRFLESGAKRKLLVDGTAHGMGKNAGNAPLELLMMYMNERYGKHYAIEQVLETIDACILPIYNRVEWGYKLRFFLSASNACHPNYVTYLLSKKNLPVSTINEVLQSIPEGKRLDYDAKLIEEKYTELQTHAKDVTYNDETLVSELHGKKILLLGPGKRLTTEKKKISAFIENEKPVVIAVNCAPEEYPIDYYFLSNSKRYSLLYSRLHNSGQDLRIIVTSNVSTLTGADYVLDVVRYWEGDALCSDNALALLLNIMKKAAPETLYLAGFDGFSASSDDNFYDKNLAMADDFNRLLAVNEELTKRIAQARTSMNIVFLTASKYE